MIRVEMRNRIVTFVTQTENVVYSRSDVEKQYSKRPLLVAVHGGSVVTYTIHAIHLLRLQVSIHTRNYVVVNPYGEKVKSYRQTGDCIEMSNGYLTYMESTTKTDYPHIETRNYHYNGPANNE